MPKLNYIALAAILFAPVIGAQEAEKESKVPSPPAIASSAMASHYDDSVTLKSGRVLQGIRVLRVTPFKLFIEIIPALEPLELPAKQVAAIDYGRPDASESPVPPPAPATSAVGASRTLQAVKISPDLALRLATPFSRKALDFNEQDLLNTLRSVGIMSGIPVTFGPELEALPREKRTMTLHLHEGISFDRFVRDTLTPNIPWLKVEYRFDSVYFEYQIPPPA
jgi:hypothetical protein